MNYQNHWELPKITKKLTKITTKRTEITGTSCRYIFTGFKNEKEKNSGSFVYFHIFFDEIISILLTVIKVTFLNPVNICLQDVLLISVWWVVILVSFLVIFGNSWHTTWPGCDSGWKWVDLELNRNRCLFGTATIHFIWYGWWGYKVDNAFVYYNFWD